MGKHHNDSEAPSTHDISEQKSWAVDRTSKSSNSAGNSRRGTQPQKHQPDKICECICNI